MSIKRIGIILVLLVIAICIVTITNCINTVTAQCTTEQLNKGLVGGCSNEQSNTPPPLGYLNPPSQSSSAVAVQNNVSRTTQPAKINPLPAGNVTAVPLAPPPKRIIVGPSSVIASPITNEIQGGANATSILPKNGLFLGTPPGR